MITDSCFPTPDLMLRSNHPAAGDSSRTFARRQAEVARRLRRDLRLLDQPRSLRVRMLAGVFRSAVQARYAIAAAFPDPAGRYSAVHVERFRTPVTDSEPMYFRIGDHPRLRDGVLWDTETATYVGGAETPASRVMRRVGAAASARFDETPDADSVSNQAHLPGGGTANGLRILRGAAARLAAAELARRIAIRHGDTSRIATDGDLLYVATSTEADRRATFQAALELLARGHEGASAALTDWATAAYLLYQAPCMRRGGDATNRMFLVATGAWLLGRAPVLAQDLDLRAVVEPQERFVANICAHQEGLLISAEQHSCGPVGFLPRGAAARG